LTVAPQIYANARSASHSNETQNAAASLSAPAIARDTRSQTLVFVPSSNLTTPDAVWTTAAVVHTHAFLIYDTLFGLDGKGVPQPQMAASYTVEDEGRVWEVLAR
jgi:peptide/nickel transport system substrate-binding protein